MAPFTLRFMGSTYSSEGNTAPQVNGATGISYPESSMEPHGGTRSFVSEHNKQKDIQFSDQPELRAGHPTELSR